MAKSSEVLTRLKDATYLGSHPTRSGQQKKLVVAFLTHGISADFRNATLMYRSWTDVRELRAEDREGLERRITATRLLGIGLLAVVFPKERTLSYLTIADERGEWIFAVPGLSSIELSSGLRPLYSRFQKSLGGSRSTALSTGPEAIQAPVNDIAARLQRLQDLYESGLVQQAEFAAKRQEIIDSL
jgi:hypothetical protein